MANKMQVWRDGKRLAYVQADEAGTLIMFKVEVFNSINGAKRACLEAQKTGAVATCREFKILENVTVNDLGGPSTQMAGPRRTYTATATTKANWDKAQREKRLRQELLGAMLLLAQESA